MKSERRHELKENDLAHLLDSFSEYLRENGARLGLAVAGVFVVVAVVGITMRSRAAALEDAWQNKRTLSFENLEDGRRSLDTLSSLTETTADRRFVLGALIDQGRYALELSQKTENPPDSEFNEKARAAYADLLSGFPENPMAFGTAHSGLATVEENAFSLDGDLGHKLKARQHLQAIIDKSEFASMPFYRMATDRLKNIDEVFTIARFVAAPIVRENEVDELILPNDIKAQRISEDQVPIKILQQVRVREDGTLEILEEKQE